MTEGRGREAGHGQDVGVHDVAVKLRLHLQDAGLESACVTVSMDHIRLGLCGSVYGCQWTGLRFVFVCGYRCGCVGG